MGRKGRKRLLVLAVVCLSSLAPHYFTEEHQRILQIIVQMISRHLARMLQIERLTSEVQRLQSDVTYRDPKISCFIPIPVSLTAHITFS